MNERDRNLELMKGAGEDSDIICKKQQVKEEAGKGWEVPTTSAVAAPREEERGVGSEEVAERAREVI
jgi:hypothetical protein